MDESELLSLIADGETETVEFKREMPRPEHLAREVVALANGRGGYVLLGVDDGEIDFDLSPVPGATLADLNMESIEKYARSKLGFGLDGLPIDVTRQLLNWKILVEQDGERKVTLTGMLFFGDRPGDFLPQAPLWLKRFKGLTTDRWHPGKEIDAPVPQAIEEAMEFVRLYTVVEEIRGLKRVQKAEYIEEVVREALVNGIAHRNYVRRGMRTRVFIFDDRIEVHSPGPLPNGVTVESMRYGVQVTRNPNIVRYLRAFGYWEGDGLGVPRMIRLCRENGIREPDFTLVGDELVVTIYSSEYERFHG